MAALSSEAILTKVYRVPASPVQIAVCRARDGVPLGAELADREDVQATFGGAEAVAALPGERGLKPSEFWIIASARTAKTTIGACGQLADFPGLDLSSLGPGEVPRISISSTKLDTADVPYRRQRAAFDHPAFRPMLVEQRDSDRMLVVRHPSGKLVEFAVVAGGRAASGMTSRFSGGLLADECTRQVGRDESTTNLDDVLSVQRERVLPGAQLIMVGSPWQPSGPAYNAVQEFFGKPSDDVVVARMRGPLANPSYWTPERLARLEKRDPVAFRINNDGEFIDAESGLLDTAVVRAQTRKEPLELAPEQDGFYLFALDPSDGGARNAFTMVGLRGDAVNGRLKLRVAVAREWRNMPLEHVWREIAQGLRSYGCEAAVTDEFSGGASVALGSVNGIKLHVDRTTAAGKLEDFGNVASMLATGDLELSPLRPLISDLLLVKKRATANGFSIFLPQTPDGRHCDFASALAKAVKFARAVPEIQRKQGRLRSGFIQGLGPITPVRQLLARGFSL
jgi:hypothetical protein